MVVAEGCVDQCNLFDHTEEEDYYNMVFNNGGQFLDNGGLENFDFAQFLDGDNGANSDPTLFGFTASLELDVETEIGEAEEAAEGDESILVNRLLERYTTLFDRRQSHT